MAPLSFLAMFAALLQGESVELATLDDAFFESELMGDEGLDLPQLRATALYQMTAARLARQAQAEEEQPEDELGNLQALDWSYNDPDAWAGLHADCGGGVQSPIALSSAVLQESHNSSLDSLLDYTDVGGLLTVNTRTAIQVDGGFGTLKLPDGDYGAIQFHFHFPAEHTIDGVLADGELHIVHQKLSAHGTFEHLAVIGIMLTVADEETARAGDKTSILLEQLGFLSGLPDQDHYVSVNGVINLRWSLERELKGPFYHYQGSLTTPPCSENVHWFVLDTPALITQVAVDHFKAHFPDPMNNRPVQPLNDRTVASSLEISQDEYGILSTPLQTELSGSA